MKVQSFILINNFVSFLQNLLSSISYINNKKKQISVRNKYLFLNYTILQINR